MSINWLSDLKQGLVLSELSFLKTSVKLFGAHYGVVFFPADSFTDAIKMIEKENQDFIVIDLHEDRLAHSIHRRTITDFITYCQASSAERNRPTTIIAVTSADREYHQPLIEASVDYILTKDHEWYRKLARIIYDEPLNTHDGKSKAKTVKQLLQQKEAQKLVPPNTANRALPASDAKPEHIDEENAATTPHTDGEAKPNNFSHDELMNSQ